MPPLRERISDSAGAGASFSSGWPSLREIYARAISDQALTALRDHRCPNRETMAIAAIPLSAEISLDDFWVPKQFPARASKGDPSVFHDICKISNLQCQTDILFDQE